ncbi:glycoside hydrolase family 2 TIM barrel-domain containing protein [Gracilibacillus kekensis]|uniref:Beta-galactosidase n=1 Tax=Gracilibacillus kekensis TaxID=1027249 RepID=A0A1M7N4V5_9BACI|nr:glycoside hydrolase family 2 TIM barrel-domain containing protein [Gracilibacillus kekensis]SHM98619.1 beta-galactosidase [Gracilibacillus kekensis]
MLNQTKLFNDNWLFAKSDLSESITTSLDFKPVEIPHDWLIYDTQNLYEHSIGWYKKKYEFDPTSGKEVVLTFEGVYMDSVLYVNDQKVGEWKYGYSKFEFPISEFLNKGTNQFLLKVTYQSPNSRWYTGAGIYRDVWLTERSKDYIETDGVYVSTFQEKDNWRVEIDTSLSVTKSLVLKHTLQKDGTVVATASADVDQDHINNQSTLTIDNPKLWDIHKPDLYELTTTLETKSDNDIIESQTQNIGFKHIEFDSDRGFFLNGQHLKLFGVNEHHDLGALGAAINIHALRHRMQLLKEMGVNAIRTAHNMPAKEMMTLADEMGFLVVTEAFDMWERSKTTYDYARFFKEWHKKDIESWVKRDRNHVSLIMWSIGNEIYDTHADERGQELTQILKDLVYQFDPKKNAVVTIGSNYMPWENAQKCADIIKFAGYNYGEKYYEEHHKKHPDWIIYGSETVAVVQSRGVYHFPYDKPILADDDQHCSSLGNSATSWGAKSIETALIKERETPFSLGQFIWSGFDYIGEPTPYHTKNAYFGSIDTATFKKDSYYVYQSAWTDYEESPMVHIFPYWDFNEGQMIDVRVATNAPNVDLLLNGQSLGIQEIDHKHGDVISGWWKVPYQKGTLEAYAYDLEGKVIAQDQKQSFGDPSDITLATADTTLKADGIDLAFVEIGMLDKKGNPVENANNRVNVEVEGAGRLIGLDNGDQTDYDQYKGTSRRLFNGKLMAIICSTFETGPIHINVHSPSLPEASLILNAKQPNRELPNNSPVAANQPTTIVTGKQNEIPVRKIEIESDNGQTLTVEQPTVHVTATLYPANTDYKEVKWSVVNDVGIESNLASIESNGNLATITAFGDGEFRVRCTSKNGKNTINLISELELKAEGLGTAFKDPYSFISAGLYDQHKGELTNGNERGVATSRDGESQIGFQDIDFGKEGSDTLTVPIFALTSEPYELQIWEGMPGEVSSTLLADAIYQKESKWNVYQEETFRLSKKLKGITSLSFVTNKKMHIKGFRFEKQSRAFEQNYAVDADKIYGDSYKQVQNRVENIGNNVSFEFEGFDFGEAGCSQLVLYGHSPIDKNTIHIRFFDGQEELAEIVEFEYSEGYKEKRIELDNSIFGKQNVSIILLPGSNFNLGWFRFES